MKLSQVRNSSKIFREVKGLPEPTDTTGFTHSEKVAESVTFNEDGSYSSTLNGPERNRYLERYW